MTRRGAALKNLDSDHAVGGGAGGRAGEHSGSLTAPLNCLEDNLPTLGTDAPLD
jgi:hypothetical protein